MRSGGWSWSSIEAKGGNPTSVSGWAHEGRQGLRADAWISIRALRKAS